MGVTMKKYTILLILIFILPTFSYTQNYFTKDGEQIFIIQADQFKVFHIPLKGKSTQYLFKLTGESIFSIQIIEPSGNKWDIHVSDNNEIMVWENIMDEGIYEIRVFTVTKNKVKFIWGEY